MIGLSIVSEYDNEIMKLGASVLTTKDEHLLGEGHLLEELLLLLGQEMCWRGVDGSLEDRLLEDLAVVEAQADLLLQHGGMVAPVLLVLLTHPLLLGLLGPSAEEAGEGVPIPTHLLLGASLTLGLGASHHVGMVLAD